MQVRFRVLNPPIPQDFEAAFDRDGAPDIGWKASGGVRRFPPMPVLPLIDALIFVGWSSLMVSFVLKGISISTRYQPTVFGLSAIDFLSFSMVCMLFGVALAARTWVKANEHSIQRAGRLQGPERGRAETQTSGTEAHAEDNGGRRGAAAGR
jgi:hypothetical protein